MTVSLNGPADGTLRVDARLIANGLEAEASGTAQPFAGVTGGGFARAASCAPMPRLCAARATCARPCRPVLRGGSLLAGDELNVTDINADVGGSSLRGKLAVTSSAPHKLTGEIDADRIDGAGLIAAAIGMPSAAPRADKTEAGKTDAGKNWVWSSEPFGDGAFGDYAGAVALKVRRLDLSPQSGRARISLDACGSPTREIGVDDMAGVIGRRQARRQ